MTMLPRVMLAGSSTQPSSKSIPKRRSTRARCAVLRLHHGRTKSQGVCRGGTARRAGPGDASTPAPLATVPAAAAGAAGRAHRAHRARPLQPPLTLWPGTTLTMARLNHCYLSQSPWLHHPMECRRDAYLRLRRERDDRSADHPDHSARVARRREGDSCTTATRRAHSSLRDRARCKGWPPRMTAPSSTVRFACPAYSCAGYRDWEFKRLSRSRRTHKAFPHPGPKTASAINSPTCCRIFGSSKTRSRSSCNDLDSGASRSRYFSIRAVASAGERCMVSCRSSPQRANGPGVC